MSAFKTMAIAFALLLLALVTPGVRAAHAASSCIRACPAREKPICGSYFDIPFTGPGSVVTSTTKRIYEFFYNKCVFNCNANAYGVGAFKLENKSKCQ